MIILNFAEKLETVLSEASFKHKSAVAVIQCRDKYLLGLSTAQDDRRNKWCFPGGHIKRNESCEKAAEREAFEETGIRCKSVDRDPLGYIKNGEVVFIHCRANTISQKFKPNHEFVILGWFRKSQLKSLNLHKTVLSMLKKL